VDSYVFPIDAARREIAARNPEVCPPIPKVVYRCTIYFFPLSGDAIGSVGSPKSMNFIP
jgi:hypothetical protein